jgi:predicted RNase H-like HicB family nuclease
MRTNITTTKHTYTAVFEPAEEGGFIVTFPALPSVVTEGDTLEQARAMAADAVRGYLEAWPRMACRLLLRTHCRACR